jgi:hypothetical protein
MARNSRSGKHLSKDKPYNIVRSVFLLYQMIVPDYLIFFIDFGINSILFNVISEVGRSRPTSDQVFERPD